MGSVKKGLVFVAVGSLLAWGCGGDDEDQDSSFTRASDLTPGHFNEEGLTSLDRQDLGDSMEDVDVHENDVSDSSSSTMQLLPDPGFSLTTGAGELGFTANGGELSLTKNPFFPGCDELQVEKDEIKSGGDHFEMVLEMDMGACIKKMFGDSSLFESIDQNKAFMTANYFWKCPGSDYSAMDGKSILDLMNKENLAELDLEKLSECKKQDTTIKRRMKLSMNMAFAGKIKSKFSKDGKSKSFSVNATSMQAAMTDKGEPCSYKVENGDVTINNSCKYLVKEHTVNRASGKGEEKEVLLVKADMKGIGGPVTREYFDDGTVKVSVNGWSGEITLDGTSTPVWSLEKSGAKAYGRIGDELVASSESGIGGSAIPPSSSGGTSGSTGGQTTSAYDLPSLDLSDNAKVHYVGMYEGEGAEHGFNQERTAGTATLNVDKPDHPVILVLGSYEPVEYTVNATAETNIELVILSGYYASTVKGLGDDVPLLASAYKESSSYGSGKLLDAEFPTFYAYKDDTEQTYEMDYINGEWQCTDEPSPTYRSKWKKAQEVVTKITGKDVSSAQGSYVGKDFAVDSSTASATLDASRQSGRCYKNEDGTITRHGF